MPAKGAGRTSQEGRAGCGETRGTGRLAIARTAHRGSGHGPGVLMPAPARLSIDRGESPGFLAIDRGEGNGTIGGEETMSGPRKAASQSGGVPRMVLQLREAVGHDGRSLNRLAKATGVDSGRLCRFTRGERDLNL